jgi:diaminopimelate epimerase
MKFTKLQGAGNDFVLVETSDAERDWSQLAIAMCDRHFGVGADGLLLLLPSKIADFQMREFNPDGSESEACGNGLRCLVKYVLDTKLVNTGAREVTIATIPGVRRFQPDKTGGTGVKVGMGIPRFAAEDIPVVMEPGKRGLVDIKLITYPFTVAGKELALSLVSMGNPHAVYFQQNSVADFPLAQVALEVRQLPIFPNEVNLEVVRVVNRKQIEARVWERGVGETLACGSGACAIAVAAQLKGYTDHKVDIKFRGGTLEVEWDGAGEAFLSGPAEIVFTGEWSE